MICLLTFITHNLIIIYVHTHTFDGWSWLYEFGPDPLTRDEATSSSLYLNTGTSPSPRFRTLERVEGEPILTKTADSALNA